MKHWHIYMYTLIVSITGYLLYKLYGVRCAMASGGSLFIIYSCASHSGSGGLGYPALTDGQVPCHPNFLLKHTHTAFVPYPLTQTTSIHRCPLAILITKERLCH